jgi:hypothetical protein
MSANRISHDFKSKFIMIQITNQLWVQSESVISSNRINQDYKSKFIMIQITNQSWVKSELIMTPIQNNQFRNIKAPNPY